MVGHVVVAELAEEVFLFGLDEDFGAG